MKPAGVVLRRSTLAAALVLGGTASAEPLVGTHFFYRYDAPQGTRER